MLSLITLYFVVLKISIPKNQINWIIKSHKNLLKIKYLLCFKLAENKESVQFEVYRQFQVSLAVHIYVQYIDFWSFSKTNNYKNTAS